MSTTAQQLERALKQLEAAEAKGSSSADAVEDKVIELKKKLKKEEAEWEPPPHPALQFGPISQTVAIMAVLSLALSVAPLPYQMLPFYRLFSMITIVAVASLVAYTSLIWYGYKEAVDKARPKPDNPEVKIKELLRKMYPERPDMWANNRSHPSAFLTTKNAPPRLFPFPLGKSRPDAAVKDELWWEGGNAPHVGHFNRPKMAAPPGPDPELLLSKVEKRIEIDRQRDLWRKRIRSIQILSLILIISFVNKKVAAAWLCWLVYSTITTEIENMLAPPIDMEEIHQTIDNLTAAAPANEKAPKQPKGVPGGGMSYIYDATSATTVAHNANIPIVGVPAPVLLTTENHWYAGPV